MGRLRVAMGMAAVAVLVGGCSGSSTSEGSPAKATSPKATTTTGTSKSDWPAPEVHGSTYVVPDGLDQAKPGDVLAAAPLPAVAELAGAKRYLLLYASQDRDGKAVPVSAQVLVPSGTAPKGGWPVVSWGHGTTGVADVCAPSLTDDLFYAEYGQEASTLLRAGYAVAASDYPGLGTPGMHPYLVGVDEGNAMVDVVTAARQLDPRLSTTWFAEGHSQGGQAALFASRAAERAPKLDLAGVVSIAPASGLQLALPAIVAGGVPADLVYGLYMLAGLSTVDHGFHVDDVLGSAGREHRDLLLEDGCLLDALPKLKAEEVAHIFALTPERAQALSKEIAAYGNPQNDPVVGPVLVVQGEDDHDVPVGLTELMVQQLSAKGSPVDYRRYPGLDHDTVLGPSVCDRLAWMAAHGGPAVPDCHPYDTDLS